MCPKVHTSAGGMRAQGDGMRVLALILAHLAPPPAQAATAFALAPPQARPPPCCCWPPHRAAVSMHRGRVAGLCCQGKGVGPLRCQEGTGGEPSSLTVDSAVEQWRRAYRGHSRSIRIVLKRGSLRLFPLLSPPTPTLTESTLRRKANSLTRRVGQCLVRYRRRRAPACKTLPDRCSCLARSYMQDYMPISSASMSSPAPSTVGITGILISSP